MMSAGERRLVSFRESLEREYARRFPRSAAHHARYAEPLLDGCSHAIRSNEPFMPIARRTGGASIEDLDGHRIVDYWQGHFANILGHNPPVVTETLAEALRGGRGLQSGMLHEVEGEVAELIARSTDMDTVRITTSGTLGTFYAMVLARAFTGRSHVVKVAGGWHGSQPLGLKGVEAHETSFDHMESEGLSSSTPEEILLTRFNDPDDLRKTFERRGDDIACFALEPVLGAGGGMAASVEYLREARRLTETHGALLLCDEIITGFRFRAGDLCSLYGVRPDLLVLGKIIGGGMPVSAVAGRRDVMGLCAKKSGRVKFEGGTYSSHELSLIGCRAMLRHLIDHEHEIYPALAAAGHQLSEGVRRCAENVGLPVHVLGTPSEVVEGGSLVFVHAVGDASPAPPRPENLARRAHPFVTERLLKACLLLDDVSTRSGLGAVTTSHTPADIRHTLEAYEQTLTRLKTAALI